MESQKYSVSTVRRRRIRDRGVARQGRFQARRWLLYPIISLFALGIIVAAIADRMNAPEQGRMLETLQLLLYEIPRPSGSELVSERRSQGGGGARAAYAYNTGFGQLEIRDYYTRELGDRGWVQLPPKLGGSRLVFCRTPMEAEVGYVRGAPDDEYAATVSLSMSSGAWALECPRER